MLRDQLAGLGHRIGAVLPPSGCFVTRDLAAFTRVCILTTSAKKTMILGMTSKSLANDFLPCEYKIIQVLRDKHKCSYI